MPHHVGVDAVELRYLNVVCLGVGADNEADTGKLGLAVGKDVLRLADGSVKDIAEGGLEVRDERRTAAVGVVGDGGFRAVGRDFRQEGRARTMVGDELCLDRDVLPLEIIRQLADVVVEARQLYHNAAAVLFDDEDLVVNEVVRLVGVQPCAAEIIYLNFALGKLYGLISVLVHLKFLRVEFSGCFPSVLLILLGIISSTSTHKSITQSPFGNSWSALGSPLQYFECYTII